MISHDKKKDNDENGVYKCWCGSEGNKTERTVIKIISFLIYFEFITILHSSSKTKLLVPYKMNVSHY